MDQQAANPAPDPSTHAETCSGADQDHVSVIKLKITYCVVLLIRFSYDWTCNLVFMCSRDFHNQLLGFQGLSAAVKAWILSTAPGQGLFRAEAWTAWVTLILHSIIHVPQFTKVKGQGHVTVKHVQIFSHMF